MVILLISLQNILLYISSEQKVLYFFGYKTEFFSFQNNPQKSRSILYDGSRSLGLFRKGKTGIKAKFHRIDLVIFLSILERRKPSLIAK